MEQANFDIEFQLTGESSIGGNVGDWFVGGWRTIDNARYASTKSKAHVILAENYKGADVFGTFAEWEITKK